MVDKVEVGLYGGIDIRNEQIKCARRVITRVNMGKTNRGEEEGGRERLRMRW